MYFDTRLVCVYTRRQCRTSRETFLYPNCFLNVFCLHSERKKRRRDHIHCFACLRIPLPSSVNDRDVRMMGPSASAKQTEQKKKKRPIINHFSSSSTAHLFIIQSCPLLINNMPIVVSSTHLASALTPPNIVSSIFRFFSCLE
jgi:hypothetical protein